MSSIALPFERQIRNLYFAEKLVSGEPSEFKKTGQAGEILPILDEVNNHVTFYLKDGSGKAIHTDQIKLDNLLYCKITEPQDKVGKEMKFKFESVTPGKAYNANLKVHYGVSETVFTTIYGSYVAVEGDTPAKVAEGVAVALGKNLAADMRTSNSSSDTYSIGGYDIPHNKYLDISVEGDTITVTEKDWVLENYVPGLRSFDQLMWELEIGTDFFEASNEVKKTIKSGKPAKGQGYQIIELERYLAGHRKEFMGKDYTVSFQNSYQGNTANKYFVLDVQYFDVPRYDPQKSEKGFTVVSTNKGVLEEILKVLQTTDKDVPGLEDETTP